MTSDSAEAEMIDKLRLLTEELIQPEPQCNSKFIFTTRFSRFPCGS